MQSRKRPHSVSSWVNGQEQAAFIERCKRDGTKPARALRQLMAAYSAGRDTAPQMYQCLTEIYEELRRLGINLNQLLRMAHTEVLRGNAPELNGLAAVVCLLVKTVERLLVAMRPYVDNQ